MTFFQDYITFTIDKRYEDKTKSGIIQIATTYLDPEESDRFSHKRLFGTVISVPKTFSEAKVRAIDPGLPTSKVFVGHDWIADKISRGYTNHSIKDYYPSTYDAYEFITMADIAKLCDIRVGDTVYFDEKITEFENYLGILDGKEHFRAPISEVFCVIRDGKILMQGGWVLVEPDMETWDDIKTPSGIIKKTKPEAKALQGFIRHVRNHEFMEAGQKIVYIANADWTLKVEGKEYYVILEDDILGAA